MKRFLAAALVLGALQACGSDVPWKSVGSDGSTDDYVRNVSYSDGGKTVTFEYLSDFVRPVDLTNGIASSSVATVSVDCTKQEATTRSVAFYAEPMGRGNVISDQQPKKGEVAQLDFNDRKDQKIRELCEKPH